MKYEDGDSEEMSEGEVVENLMECVVGGRGSRSKRMRIF